MYFGVSFLLCTCYVLEISYKLTTLCKTKCVFIFFPRFAKIVEKKDMFKILNMPPRLCVGVLAFQNGVILWGFPLSWCSRAFIIVIGCQEMICDMCNFGS